MHPEIMLSILIAVIGNIAATLVRSGYWHRDAPRSSAADSLAYADAREWKVRSGLRKKASAKRLALCVRAVITGDVTSCVYVAGDRTGSGCTALRCTSTTTVIEPW